MKNVILFDALSFVGYGLCLKMVDEEILVWGIDKTPKENSLEEERMYRIGRNANFQFVEYPKSMLDQTMFKQVDAVIYPWLGPYSIERNKVKDEKLHSVISHCNETKTKLILVSSNLATNESSDDLAIALDEDWFSKIDIKNSLCDHQKIRTKNTEFLFTFIEFSNNNIIEGTRKKDEHLEWVSQNF
ncbi:hypothetical protein [Bacillus sinesaloumensis]|uniref:hypothetical protein n=1 Tax=Litchfieldia sinesaloumensis TaxID=1926280 RepID=UPI00098867C6|nr:hypothetical protein [Bacillus sinesaloumensis]